jgi:hypothetical protein
MGTVFEPAKPLPPVTTVFIANLLVRRPQARLPLQPASATQTSPRNYQGSWWITRSSTRVFSSAAPLGSEDVRGEGSRFALAPRCVRQSASTTNAADYEPLKSLTDRMAGASRPPLRGRSATDTDTRGQGRRSIRDRERLPIQRLACSRRDSSSCLACTVTDAPGIPQRTVLAHNWCSLTRRSSLRERPLEPAPSAFRLEQQPKSRSACVDSRSNLISVVCPTDTEHPSSARRSG